MSSKTYRVFSICFTLLFTALGAELGAGSKSLGETKGLGVTVTPPDPSPLSVLIPQIAAAGPPKWLCPGTRIVFYAASAQVRHASVGIALDENGKWVDLKTGKRYGQFDIPTASGHGYTVVDVGSVGSKITALSITTYLMDPTKANALSFGTISGAATHSAAGLHYWVNPKALAKLNERNDPTLKIVRMPYILTGKRYSALRIETRNAKGYSAYTYDLATGILLLAGSATQGKSILAPPLGVGGKARYVEGNTFLTTCLLYTSPSPRD